jgi:alpha-tubulin suppressor-like RCC1 family protein
MPILVHDNFTIVAWGRATMGQFLTAETVTLTTPTVIVNDTNRIGGPGTVITSIRASEYIVAVVTSTNNVYKWGYSGTACTQTFCSFPSCPLTRYLLTN